MKWPRVVYLAGAALVLIAIALWMVTGREGYTRWPNEALAKADAPPAAGEGDLLSEAGFSDGAPARPDIQSRFALGLVPGGKDVKHVISVASVAGAVAAAAVITYVVRRRQFASRTVCNGVPS
jgi:hypothetical protein